MGEVNLKFKAMQKSVIGKVLLLLIVTALFAFPLSAMTFTDTHGDDDPETNGTDSGWTLQSGAASNWPEASSYIKPTSNNIASQITNDNIFANDGVVTCSLTLQTTGPSGTNGCNTAGILFRWTDTSSFYYVRFARTASTGSADEIYFHTNTIASAAGTQVATGISTGNPFEFKITAVADSFTFFVNGSQVGQVVDGTHSSGRVGYGKVATWDQQVTFYSISWYDSSGNSAPTDIGLSPSAIVENQASGTYIGVLTSTDSDGGDSHTYSLVAGTGDGDNTAATISNDTLFSNAVFDYESKASYNIRVKTDDGNGGTYEKAMTFTITNGNDTPTDIALSSASISEGLSSGTFIGKLTTTDQDADGHTYTFASGGADNASFSISNDSLFSGAIYDYDIKNSYSIKIRTTDNGAGSLWYEETFGITILEVENANDWTSSMLIYINTTASGTNTASDLYDVPLLVRLDPSNFTGFANTNANGEDVRFVKSDGTTFLSYEKEFWKDGASDNDTAAFWVKIDTVLGNNSTQYITMLWEKAGETSTGLSANVFETSNNFTAVYHLSEEQAGTGNTGLYTDATGNANDADDQVSATGQDAVAKEGQEFDGTDDYINIPQSASLNISGDASMSGWFKLDGNFTSASTGSQVLITKYQNNDNNMSISLAGTDYDLPLISDGALVFKVESRDSYPGEYKFVWTNTTNWVAGQWYYFTVVIDADNSANNKIYIDGVDDTD